MSGSVGELASSLALMGQLASRCARNERLGENSPHIVTQLAVSRLAAELGA
jgi:hypothetical protein